MTLLLQKYCVMKCCSNELKGFVFSGSHQEWGNERLSVKRSQLAYLIVWEWNQWNFGWWDGEKIVNITSFLWVSWVPMRNLLGQPVMDNILPFFLIKKNKISSWANSPAGFKGITSFFYCNRVLVRLCRPFLCWVTWSISEKWQVLILLLCQSPR